MRTQRRNGARPGRRNSRSTRRRSSRRVSWRRRTGVAAVLIFLAGASIAFASFSLHDRPVSNVQSPSPSAMPGGSPPLTEPPTATPDQRAPNIQVTQPAADEIIYTSSVTLRGRTEAGANMDVLDEVSNEHLPVQVDPDGRFVSTVPLEVGHNWLTLTSQDAAGNAGHRRVDLVRTASAATAELTVEPTSISLAALPQRVRVSASVTDDLGEPADDVQVTFSLSPPNAPTMTYATRTVHGQASWPNLVINNDGLAAGQWLVTVLVELPSGNEVRADASFSVR